MQFCCFFYLKKEFSFFFFKFKEKKCMSQRKTKPTKWHVTCAPSEDPDQPGHTQSNQCLRCPHEESLGLSYPLSAQQRL